MGVRSASADVLAADVSRVLRLDSDHRAQGHLLWLAWRATES
nr:hypothetical protein ICEMyc226_00207 [Mycolicibacterium sp.]